MDDLLNLCNPFTDFVTKSIVHKNKATQFRFYDAKPKGKSGKKIITDYAAYSDGQDIYLLKRNEAIQLKRIGNDYFAEARLTRQDLGMSNGNNVQLGTAIAMGIMFGAIGGMAIVSSSKNDIIGTFQLMLDPTTGRLQIMRFLF